MKKIIYLFLAFAMIFLVSCNPLEDIYDDLDEAEALAAANPIAKIIDAEYTLIDEDYEALDLSFGNFSSEDEAKSLLPEFLSNKYAGYGATFNEDGSVEETSSILVKYELFSPIKFEEYTVTSADYSAIGLTSLSDSDDFNDFFDYKFPSEEKGTVVDLTYNVEPTINEYTLTDEDYDLVGNGQFNNFEIGSGEEDETIEARRAKIQIILLNNFPDAEEGSIYNVIYEGFNAGLSSTLELIVRQQQNEPNASLTTNYTLTEDDFELVGNGFFDNFDIRDGEPEETIEIRREKIEEILLNNYPATSVGALYNVTYAVWEGFDSTRDMLLEFDGSGYTIFDTTSYELYTFEFEEATTRFTFSDDWAAPITFTEEEYTLMGQNFPNFSDEEEALYTIAIYLRTLFQFAAPDDFVAVEYDLFVSGSGVSQENVNFVFDGTVWNAIPSVIETELQFGHDGTTWVPDNTIKYTLTSADFELVGNGDFSNFDVREGQEEETIEVRLEKINTILLNNFPEFGEGQKVSVSYAVWEPGDAVYIMNVIHNGTEYILQ